MEVYVAKTAGFCFGVKRAVDMVYDRIGQDRIYTFGPIIHNEEVVKELESKGVTILNTIDDILQAPAGTVVIRAHGVSTEIYDAINKTGHELVDATCPFVLKIHNIVREATQKGEFIAIIGDRNHPEVIGIESCVKDNCVIIKNVSEAEEFFKIEGNKHKKLTIVAQTTYNFNKFTELVEIFRKNSYHIVDVMNTICNATRERQLEADKLSGQMDAMIVIGGRHSSNTVKLFDICKKNCANTFFVQTAADIDFSVLHKYEKIGITAGASTPNNIIEEVQTNVRRKF